MSFYLRKKEQLVCCKQAGKVSSKSFKKKTPVEALDELCTSLQVFPSPERKYDLLFAMAKERGCAFPQPECSLEDVLAWRAKGMPGQKYECSTCTELFPTATCLAQHLHDKHVIERPAEQCLASLSQRCQPGMLYFTDLPSIEDFLKNRIKLS